jgi:hypothetical protein
MLRCGENLLNRPDPVDRFPIVLVQRRAIRTPRPPHSRRLAVNSAFRKLKNLYAKIVPIFDDYGFTPPSAGVIARDLSEETKAIIQYCESSTKSDSRCDLYRFRQQTRTASIQSSAPQACTLHRKGPLPRTPRSCGHDVKRCCSRATDDVSP